MSTILLVEDDTSIQTSLGLYLSNSGYSVLSAMNGLDVMPLLRTEKVDLIILDINLPGQDGKSLCREIRKDFSIPIIMLSARDAEEDKIETLESGADDYVSKPFSPRELLARVSAIFGRAKRTEDQSKQATDWAEQNGMLAIGDIRIDTRNYHVVIGGEEIRLTKTEFMLLEHLVRHVGTVVARETLMKEIMGYDNYLYDRTIDTHIKNIRKKLE